MGPDITGRCRNHSFDFAESVCRRCGLEFCDDCVVRPFGKSKPFCKDCAMVLGGVKTHGIRPPMTSKQIRSRVKAFSKRTPSRTRVEAAVQELIPAPMMVPTIAVTDPAAGVAPPIDWSRPFG